MELIEYCVNAQFVYINTEMNVLLKMIEIFICIWVPVCMSVYDMHAWYPLGQKGVSNPL